MLKNLPEEVRKQIGSNEKRRETRWLADEDRGRQSKEMKLDGLLKGVDSSLPAEMQKQLAELEGDF